MTETIAAGRPTPTEIGDALTHVLRRQLGDGTLRVVDVEPLTAGASRGMWRFRAEGASGGRDLVLRRDQPGSADPAAMLFEVALMRAAHDHGVASPAVVASGTGEDEIGVAYVVMERVEGETLPRRILRDDTFAGLREGLARECGRLLARIHRIGPEAVPGLDRRDQLEAWREQYDAYDQPSPTFEVALRWLERHRPSARQEVVVHGDFRNGNLMVGPDGVRAVLDWELAHLGQPAEDLGWLCAPAWRFGAPGPVGGFGTAEDLLEGYREEGGAPITPDELHWWIVFATFRWGVICLRQAERHRSGAERSVELALIGRRVAEVEWDLLRLID